MGKKEGAAVPAAGGVYAALATPRLQNAAEADAAALFDYIDALSAKGLAGLVLFGSTGEFIHYDIGERMRVLMLARKRSRLPVIVNVSHSTLVGAIDLAEDAVEADAAGLLLMPPYYFRYNSAQIREFYRQFTREIGNKARIYIYNIPQFTNAMAPELIEELLASGAFAGIKDSSGDWSLCERLLALRAQREFRLIIGNDAIYRRARMLGADGIISGVAAAAPELLLSLDQAIQAKDDARAKTLDARLQEFLAWLDKFPAPIGIKVAACARGWKLDNSAVPYDAETTAAKHEFESWLKDWLPQVL